MRIRLMRTAGAIAAAASLLMIGSMDLRAQTAAPAAKAKAKVVARAKVDLNTATQEELENLPGIGPAHAKAIIAARPIKSIEELAKVKGIGESRANALKDQVLVGSAPSGKAAASKSTASARPAPGRGPARKAMIAEKAVAKAAPAKIINLNKATKEELELLPGIGPVKAQAIIDARPFKEIEDIKKIKGIKEGEFAKIKHLISVK